VGRGVGVGDGRGYGGGGARVWVGRREGDWRLWCTLKFPVEALPLNHRGLIYVIGGQLLLLSLEPTLPIVEPIQDD